LKVLPLLKTLAHSAKLSGLLNWFSECFKAGVKRGRKTVYE